MEVIERQETLLCSHVSGNESHITYIMKEIEAKGLSPQSEKNVDLDNLPPKIRPMNKKCFSQPTEVEAT